MTFVSIVIVLGCVVAASPLGARGDWYYRLNGVACGYEAGKIVATAPLSGANGNVSSWYGGRETVYWRSLLQRFYSGGWYTVNNRMPWLQGVANAAGILPLNIAGVYYWVDSRTNQSLQHHWYTNLPSGSYRVEEFFRWPASGVTRAAFARSYNNQLAAYCRL